jgi:phage-related protein
MSATSILINIGAQTAAAVREIDKVGGALQNNLTGAEKWRKGIKSAAAPAALGLAAVGTAALGLVKGSEEAAATSAKLGQVFESMGYEKNADDAERYAEALSKQIGVDDDIIKGAQTKLATFSEVAKSTKLMGQAAGIAADLSAAGFGSMDSQAVMVGKALQDPIKGVGALAKVGVTFTQQQKDQIAAMVKAGDTAGAQAVIMGALKEQVGGVAEAGATNSQKMSVAFGDLGETVGNILLPIFEALVPKLQAFAEWASNNAGPITIIVGALAALAAIVVVVNAAMAVATAVTTAFGVAMAIATSPITLIVLAIAAVIAIGVLLYKNWDTITAWLGRLWQSIKDKAVALWGGLKDWFARTWDAIKEKLAAAWEGIKSAVSTGIGAVVTFVKELPGKVVKGLGNLASTLFSKGVDLIQGLIDGYMSMWGSVLSFAGDIAGKIGKAIGGLGSALFQKGKDLIQGFIDGIKSMAGRILDAILGILPGPVRSIIKGALGLSMPATGGGVAAGRMAGGSTRSASTYGGGGLTIIVQGAIDPEATARQIRSLLSGHDSRQGRAPGQALARAW